MSHDDSNNGEVINRSALPAKFGSALTLLLDAFDYSQRTDRDRWEFAVDIQDLHATGLAKNDLRFLVRQKLVEHAAEVTLLGRDGRQFQSTGDLTFTERTCMVLTPSGVSAAIEFFKPRTQTTTSKPSLVLRAPVELNRSPKPSWDPDRRLLCLDDTIVKQFRWPAANQEAILAAFDEEDWCPRIDDPLPPQPEQDSKRRLSDTIKCLNRKQANHLIHFRGDGTGEGVLWERVAANGHGSNGNGSNS